MQNAALLGITDSQKKLTFLWIFYGIYINLHNSYNFYMSFSLPFFSSRSRVASPEAAEQQVVEERGLEGEPPPYEGLEKASHALANAPLTGGLAAIVLQQSTSGPLAPPARRLASYMSPSPAIAASLALAAQSPVEVPASVESPPPTAPAAHHFNAIQSLQSRDVAQMRVELESEIEQVRQDLFGAAMGVSALKDRLDGLESTVEKPAEPPATFTAEMIPTLAQNWLDAHLPGFIEQSVQKALELALQKKMAELSSHEFFRMPVPVASLTSDPFLSQPPQILSASIS